MNFLNLKTTVSAPVDTDDECTESTQKIVRSPRVYYFDIVLEIVQVHTKQNIE